MPDEPTYEPPLADARYLTERTGLIDAAREAARTFDKAVLAFGSAVFAASVGFLKDVAPHPKAYTLIWLEVSWALFSAGLLAVLLSFLFSQTACTQEIEFGYKLLTHPGYIPPKNKWSMGVEICNYLCVMLLFVGLIAWSTFAIENLKS